MSGKTPESKRNQHSGSLYKRLAKVLPYCAAKEVPNLTTPERVG